MTATAPAARTVLRARSPRPHVWLGAIALVGWAVLVVLTVVGGHHDLHEAEQRAIPALGDELGVKP